MSKPSAPLNALRAFATAARHGNLKDAAGELFVTPSALSHQIRHLEEALGHKLFHRSPAGLNLTEAGETIFPEIDGAFQQIERALARLATERHEHLLTISMLSTFAMRWFIPRLADFQQQHPDIEVRISTSTTPVDFSREEVDCAIRVGDGKWPGLHAEYLFTETFTPVCSPTLLQSSQPLKTPEDLQHHTLLHARLRPDDWRIWLHAVDIDNLQPAHQQTFETRNFAIQAAVEALGVAIVNPSLVTDELRTGRLVAPFSQTMADKSAYYLVYPEQYRHIERIRAFEQWLLTQTKENEQE